MSFIRYFTAGLRSTPWPLLIQDIGAIALVLFTPHALYAIYTQFQLEFSFNEYVGMMTVVSPLVAISMVMVMHYRLYRTGLRAG